MYELLIEQSAEKDINKIPKQFIPRIIQKINALAQNPKPPGCKKIGGSVKDWRIRIGDYRAIYEIMEEEKIIRLLRVKHRKDIYRNIT